MTAAAVTKLHPDRKLSTAAFACELAALTQVFGPLLLLSLTSKVLPQLDFIYNYSFQMPNYSH